MPRRERRRPRCERHDTPVRLAAHARVGVTVIMPGDEADALAPLPLALLSTVDAELSTDDLERFRRWGLRTLGDLAKLPPADLVSRMSRAALMWQAMARGEDIRPL